jgi:hypothetical protein
LIPIHEGGGKVRIIIEDVGKVKSCSMGGTGENIFLQEQL